MQISSTHNTNVTQKKTARPQEPEARKTEVHRPLQESWTVAGETYSTTEELIASVGELENAEATYTYQKMETPEPFTQGEKIKNAIGGGIMTGAVGAGLGLVGSIGLTVLAGIGELATSFAGARANPVSNLVLAAPIFLGAAVGAGFGGVTAYSAQVESGKQSVPGLMTAKSNEVSFYPKGKVDEKVDVNAYQRATTPELTPGDEADSSPLRDSLTGAGVVAGSTIASVTALSFWIPTAVGANIGAKIDNRTLLGPALGGLAGAGLTAGFWTAASAGYALPALGVAAVAGAIGTTVFTNSLNSQPANRDYGDQWWIKNTPEPPQY